MMMKGRELSSIQAAETLERNTFNTLFGFSQVNTANSVGSRFALAAGNTLGTVDLERASAQLANLGAYEWLGSEDVNPKVDAKRDADSLSRKMPSPHFIAVMHRFVASDLRMQSSFQQASAYSDVNKLYNSEVGQWAGCRCVASNMVPFFTGATLISGTAVASGGSLTSTNYFVLVTEADPIRQYEQNIHQVSGAIAVTGPNGSITVVLPASSYTYTIYLGTTASPTNLALCSAGPLSGPYQGMSTQLAGGQTVTLTGIGTPQVPPSPVATGVTVYPTWVLGKYAYTQVVLDDIQIQYLDKADKADPFNQLRECTWKVDYGTLLDANLFCVRIESASAFNSTFA
jgi:hypothetical protein